MEALTPTELASWSSFIFQCTGIVIGPEKRYLIENRLAELRRERGCGSWVQLYQQCRYSPDPGLTSRVIDAMVTPETSFFRDPGVFEAVELLLTRELIPRRREATGDRPLLRIWSAACSTGQEPLSLAMLLRENLPDLAAWDVEVLATDVSGRACRRAGSGRFSQIEVERGLERARLERHFLPIEGGGWRARPGLMRLLRFRRLNLVRDPLAELGTFDLILCRNVAIYFDQATKQRLVADMAQALSPRGYLLAGSSESFAERGGPLEAVSRYGATFYRRRPRPGH